MDSTHETGASRDEDARLVASLDTLAARIEAEHQAAHAAARSAVEHAIACGRLLIDAKAAVGHGEWLPWLAANTTVSARQSQRYTRIAQAVIDGKCDAKSFLTIEGALAAIAAPQPLPNSVAEFLALKMREIDPRIRLHNNGLDLPDGLAFEQWAAIGDLLHQWQRMANEAAP